jgi:hypothetical protein
MRDIRVIRGSDLLRRRIPRGSCETIHQLAATEKKNIALAHSRQIFFHDTKYWRPAVFSLCVAAEAAFFPSASILLPAQSR